MRELNLYHRDDTIIYITADRLLGSKKQRQIKSVEDADGFKHIEIFKIEDGITTWKQDDIEFLKQVISSIKPETIRLHWPTEALSVLLESVTDVLSECRSLKVIFVSRKIEGDHALPFLRKIVQNTKSYLTISYQGELPQELCDLLEPNTRVSRFGMKNDVPYSKRFNLELEKQIDQDWVWMLEADPTLQQEANANFSRCLFSHYDLLYCSSVFAYDSYYQRHSGYAYATEVQKVFNLLSRMYQDAYSSTGIVWVNARLLMSVGSKDVSSIFVVMPVDLINTISCMLFNCIASPYCIPPTNIKVMPDVKMNNDQVVEEMADEDTEDNIPVPPAVTSDKAVDEIEENKNNQTVQTENQPYNAPVDQSRLESILSFANEHKLECLAATICVAGVAYLGYRIYNGDISISDIVDKIWSSLPSIGGNSIA